MRNSCIRRGTNTNNNKSEHKQLSFLLLPPVQRPLPYLAKRSVPRHIAQSRQTCVMRCACAHTTQTRSVPRAWCGESARLTVHSARLWLDSALVRLGFGSALDFRFCACSFRRLLPAVSRTQPFAWISSRWAERARARNKPRRVTSCLSSLAGRVT